jgi:hypothetical protein
MDDSKTKKVICPVEGKDGKTHWLRLGRAYVNRDSSINLFLDGLPVNGRLQVRDWDEKDGPGSPAPGLAGRGPAGAPPVGPPHAGPRDEMPF